jgi:glyoxylase-like metal-dependent hydrolase (beta-lactamase superfamily II)
MDDFNAHPLEVSASCPFTISPIQFDDGANDTQCDTWLIREHDEYGEYPHIYAKMCSSPLPEGVDGQKTHQVLILSDTGCGTEVVNPTFGQRKEPSVWNLGTFLEYTINAGRRIPYLVMTTHCHYDHIMGIGKLPSTSTDLTRHGTSDHDERGSSSLNIRARRHSRSKNPGPLPTTVLTSSHSKAFVTPYSHLQKNSLCGSNGLEAPEYDVGMWAEDMEQVVFQYPSSTFSHNDSGSATRNVSLNKSRSIATPLTTLHTPGHTPDSLSWYDADLRLLCVGDSFYVKETKSTRSAPWGPEPAMPTIFDVASDLADWWESLDKILRFVRGRNEASAAARREETGDQEHGDRKSMNTEDEERPEIGPRRDSSPWWRKWRPTSSAPQSGFDRPFPGLRCPPEPRFQEASISDSHSPSSSSSSRDGGNWILVDLPSSTKAPRVRLAAAHTTVALDAEAAILSIRTFMARVLRDEVPKKCLQHGRRGEERWVWDYALEEANVDEVEHSKGLARNLRYLYRYSVLAPLKVIEDGRRKIPRHKWSGGDDDAV